MPRLNFIKTAAAMWVPLKFPRLSPPASLSLEAEKTEETNEAKLMTAPLPEAPRTTRRPTYLNQEQIQRLITLARRVETAHLTSLELDVVAGSGDPQKAQAVMVVGKTDWLGRRSNERLDLGRQAPTDSAAGTTLAGDILSELAPYLKADYASAKPDLRNQSSEQSFTLCVTRALSAAERNEVTLDKRYDAARQIASDKFLPSRRRFEDFAAVVAPGRWAARTLVLGSAAAAEVAHRFVTHGHQVIGQLPPGAEEAVLLLGGGALGALVANSSVVPASQVADFASASLKYVQKHHPSLTRQVLQAGAVSSAALGAGLYYLSSVDAPPQLASLMVETVTAVSLLLGELGFSQKRAQSVDQLFNPPQPNFFQRLWKNGAQPLPPKALQDALLDLGVYREVLKDVTPSAVATFVESHRQPDQVPGLPASEQLSGAAKLLLKALGFDDHDVDTMTVEKFNQTVKPDLLKRFNGRNLPT